MPHNINLDQIEAATAPERINIYKSGRYSWPIPNRLLLSLFFVKKFDKKFIGIHN